MRRRELTFSTSVPNPVQTGLADGLVALFLFFGIREQYFLKNSKDEKFGKVRKDLIRVKINNTVHGNHTKIK